MIGKTQSMVLFIMTAMVMIPIASYADEEYFGLTDKNIIRYFGDDGINSAQEHANAKLLNDIYLTLDDTSLISDSEIEQFWDNDVIITLVGPSDNPNEFHFAIHDKFEQNENDIRQKLEKFYPDANYTLDFMSVSFGKPVPIESGNPDERFPGLSQEYIVSYFGADGITTPQEAANAKIFNDVALVWESQDELIQNTTLSEFWEDEATPYRISYVNDTTIHVGISKQYEQNADQIISKIKEFYPDAKFTWNFGGMSLGPLTYDDMDTAKLDNLSNVDWFRQVQEFIDGLFGDTNYSALK